jgi:LysM repeat protein
MKTAKILGIVFSLHFTFFFFILIQPGCGTLDLGEAPEMEARPTATGLREARVPPTRPEGDLLAQQQSAAIGSLESSLNAADFSLSGEDLSAPADSSFASEASREPSFETYTVARGDNPSTIARRFGVPLAALLDLNGLDRNSVIRVGQELRIPQHAGSPAAPAPSADLSMPLGDMPTYTVRSGDTLSRIASQTGASVADIRSANNLRSDVIRVGQELRIPASASRVERLGTTPPAGSQAQAQAQRPSAAPTLAPGERGTHTIRPGENPSTIAARYGMQADELLALNNITDPRRLRPGQELIVRAPGGTTADSGAPIARDRAPAAIATPPPSIRPMVAPTPTPTPAAIRVAPTPAPTPRAFFDDLPDDDIPIVTVTPDA